MTLTGPRAPGSVHRLAIVFAAGTALAAFASGQTTGNVEGSVKDSAGAPLPGASLILESARLQGIRTDVAGKNGEYRFPAVPPGDYRVTAALPGFRSADRSGTVTLDATTTIDLALMPAVEEQVAVSGRAPLIDTTSTTTGTTYTNRVTWHLPLGRNYAEIVRANPGVDSDRGATQGRSLALTVYGATSAENQWLIDGINTTDVIKGSQGKAINNEFVEEVEVKTGAYQAEYGRALGGVINVITRSGGNDFHGDGFFYGDGSGTASAQKITAADSVIADMRVASYDRADFGADLGGFLVRDRLWFFAAYDRINVRSEVSRYVSTPFVSASDRFPVNAANNLYSGKLTWNVARGSTVVGTVFADPTTNTGAAASDPTQGFGGIGVPPVTSRTRTTWDATRTIGGRDYGLRLDEVFGSTAFVTLQGSRHEDRYDLSAPDLISTVDETCEGGTPTAPCALPIVPNNQTGGYGFIYGPSDHNDSHRDQLRGDTTLFLGNHEIKAGADHQAAKTLATSSFTGGQLVRIRNERGTLYYRHAFYAVAQDDLTPLASVTVAPQSLDTGVFLQDSWRPGPGWTVNAGMRWDREQVRNFAHDTVIDTKEWQPRLGIVWDPTREGKTKIYGFAGRFSYALPTDLAVRAYGNQTRFWTYNFDPVSLVQDPSVPGHSRPVLAELGVITPVDRGLRAISQDELTLGVERLVNPTTVVTLKGTYRRLHNAIEDRCDLDYTQPESNGSACGIVNPGSSAPIASGNIPGCNGLYDGTGEAYACTDTIPPTPPARRVYRGIEVSARRSWTERVWLQASYVFSSLRGNYDGEVSNGYFGQTDPGINADFDYPAGYHNSYGRLYLDRPHRLRLDGYYVTPIGLTVGLQAYVSSGAPLNKQGFFNDGYGSYVQLVPKGYEGRLPADWDANLTLAYPIPLGPVTVTLQAYVFRLFNRQTPTSQDTAWTNSPPADYPASLYDPAQPSDNPEYGKYTSRQPPRLLRGAIRVSF